MYMCVSIGVLKIVLHEMLNCRPLRVVLLCKETCQKEKTHENIQKTHTYKEGQPWPAGHEGCCP